MNIFGMVTTRSSTTYTSYALESFFRHTCLEDSDRFLLIDNDGSFAKRELDKYPAVEFLVNDIPRSFAENMNTALREAEACDAELYFLNNDLIFTPNWLTPLASMNNRIVLPSSNVEFKYRAGDLEINPTMDLAEYLGKESLFQAISQAHCRAHNGFKSYYRPAYFCVKIPALVYKSVGLLDEGFGAGGAEDMDYSIRAILQGFEIGYALDSFILHFQGKSTWRGAETESETRNRNDRYIAAFRDKWGEALTRLFIFGDEQMLDSREELVNAMRDGHYHPVVEALLGKRVNHQLLFKDSISSPQP